MSNITDVDPAHNTNAPSVTPAFLQQRLAEAASYAVLRRIGPVLRHDVAGFMQPVAVLMQVLQRRVQVTEPDVQAIAQSVTLVSALTKEARTGCMNAMSWLASSESAHVSLRSNVDEAIKLLAMEFSASELKLVNSISDEQTTAPQNFLRSVFMGALLAFCDQCAAGGTLQVTLEAANGNSDAPDQLLLRMLPDAAFKSLTQADIVRESRCIDWLDVEAMAGTFNVMVARGDGWLVLDLPKPSLS